MKTRIRKGDLIKLKVPPFSVGLVIDVGPGLYLGGHNKDQLLAVMWQDYDKLMKCSRLPDTASRSVEKFLKLKAFPDMRDNIALHDVMDFVVRNATCSVSQKKECHSLPKKPMFDICGKLHSTSKPIAIINTHYQGRLMIKTISKATEL